MHHSLSKWVWWVNCHCHLNLKILVETYVIGIDSFRLNKSVTFPRVSACTEW